MKELKSRIHDESNGLDYILLGDYYVPDLKLPQENRPTGKWGRLYRAYLQQYLPALFSTLCLSGELHTCLADLNEQATTRCNLIIEQKLNKEDYEKLKRLNDHLVGGQCLQSEEQFKYGCAMGGLLMKEVYELPDFQKKE